MRRPGASWCAEAMKRASLHHVARCRSCRSWSSLSAIRSGESRAGSTDPRVSWRMEMGNGRFFSIATAAVVVLNLGVVTVSGADAAKSGSSDLCVAVSGGTVQNATVLDIAADGGTGIGDASGGNGNLAAEANSGHHDNGNGNNNGNNNHNNNDNNNNNHHNNKHH